MSRESAASRYSQGAFVQSILCATDFSSDSINAFAHALMIAINLRCSFTLLHASASEAPGQEWSHLPGVRDLLERWGYLEEGSSRRAVFEKVAVDVMKVHVPTRNALRALVHYIETHPTDLVVVGTDGPSGAASWFHATLPESVIRDSRTMTLFVPAIGKGFVSPATGGFTLKRVLVPVTNRPDPQPAITHAFRSAVFSSEDTVHISVLHVGDANTAPKVEVPERPYIAWETLFKTGNAAEEILKTAEAIDCDLIVMTTGAHGFRGALRGSVTQQVIRSTTRPLLAVPVGA